MSGTSQKTLQLLRKRLRQLARVMRAVTIGLAVAAGALAIWWLNSLNGLPDIGDPFDVAAFRATRLPENRNAFILFRQAEEKLTPQAFLPPAVNRSAVIAAWSKTDPRLRAWVEENRQALELFQKGAQLADASLDLSGDPLTFHNSEVNPNTMIVLVLLEGSRPQEKGDMAGAWDCFRAALRATALVSRWEHLWEIRLYFGCNWVRQRLATRAADPRTTIPQLHATLDEALKTEPRPDWDSHTLKLRYLEVMRALVPLTAAGAVA
jgi:hypothetical protein